MGVYGFPWILGEEIRLMKWGSVESRQDISEWGGLQNQNQELNLTGYPVSCL